MEYTPQLKYQPQQLRMRNAPVLEMVHVIVVVVL